MVLDSPTSLHRRPHNRRIASQSANAAISAGLSPVCGRESGVREPMCVGMTGQLVAIAAQCVGSASYGTGGRVCTVDVAPFGATLPCAGVCRAK
jgi:hypothetical protein